MRSDSHAAIWTNANLADAALAYLVKQTGEHPLLHAADGKTSNLHAGTPDPQLAAATIAFGQPDPQQIIDLPNVKWVHLTSAGYTRYDTDAMRAALRSRGGQLTNSSSVYNDPCAQHVIAMMLAGARQLPQAYAEHHGVRGWRSTEVRAGCYLLTGQSALIYGYGAIARRLVEFLKPFDMKITAVRRTVRGDENCDTVTLDAAEPLLATADHVINILPASDSTTHFFDAARLGKLKPEATFYNIGRGTTVDQAALVHVLQRGLIKAAFLDVTDPEPLLSDSPLWAMENCHLTPHSAGGHATEFMRLAEHFVTNLRHFDAGQPLQDRVF